MEEVPYLRKRTNDNLKYSFAGEADLISKLRPAMVRHGITAHPVAYSVISETEYTTGRNATRMGMITLALTFRFTGPDGSFDDVVVVCEAADMGDKRSPKAHTIGLKYALRQYFLIETGDDPDEVANSRNAANAPLVKRALAAINAAQTRETLDELQEKFRHESAGFDGEQLADLDIAIDKQRRRLK